MSWHTVRSWRVISAVLLIAALAACSSSTDPNDGNGANNGTPGGAGCGTTATGTIGGSIDGVAWNATCIQAAVQNGTVSIVATDGTTGLVLGFPATGGTLTLTKTSAAFTSRISVGSSIWDVDSGTLTVSVTSTTIVGNGAATFTAEPGTPASGTRSLVVAINIKY